MMATIVWLRRCVLGLLLLLAAAWVFEEGAQWVLRRRAEALLKDIRSLELGKTSSEQAQRVLFAHREYFRQTTCEEGVCQYSVKVDHILPESHGVGAFEYGTAALGRNGYFDEHVHNYLPKLIARFGLRTSGAIGGFTATNGVVTGRWFGEMTSVPVGHWFDRDGAFVPYLTVSSSEAINLQELPWTPEFPHRRARHYKGPYGLRVEFDINEAATERRDLMDFRFNCITQFVPCLHDGDILPEGEHLLDQNMAQLRGRRN
jgi:hypothetical protein